MMSRFGRAMIFAAACGAFTAVTGGCKWIRVQAIDLFTPKYEVETPANLEPSFTGKDVKRDKVMVGLLPVADGMKELTDIQFPPTSGSVMYVLTKAGKLHWFDLKRKRRGLIAELKVPTSSEQGLLGLAFHPDFKTNGLFYLNYSVESGGPRRSRVAEWKHSNPAEPGGGSASEKRIIFEIEQPYQNHNAGQLAFGPDGMLYVGWGDGGFRDDPNKDGQNTKTLLGTMMRIDVNKSADGKNYAIPADNPFVGNAKYRPEIWAYGLRNPWKYSFGPRGRLIVADVGQNAWEEISVVERGGNYGWNVFEADHCFDKNPACAKAGSYVRPVWEYGREEGGSITGGFVYTGNSVGQLKGRYLFGDFMSGRIWALELPADSKAGPKASKVHSLGKWPVLISTFGRDNSGEVYVGDYAKGVVYKITVGKKKVAARKN